MTRGYSETEGESFSRGNLETSDPGVPPTPNQRYQEPAPYYPPVPPQRPGQWMEEPAPVQEAPPPPLPSVSSFSRESIETPVQNERELMKETERVATAVQRKEQTDPGPDREVGGFTRDEGVVRIHTDSRVADVFEAPMRKGLFGVTRMDTFPFKIMINSRVVKPRQLISLVHEMLHVWAKLHKVEELPHDKLHDLAVFIFSEILPVVDKYKNRR